MTALILKHFQVEPGTSKTSFGWAGPVGRLDYTPESVDIDPFPPANFGRLWNVFSPSILGVGESDAAYQGSFRSFEGAQCRGWHSQSRRANATSSLPQNDLVHSTSFRCQNRPAKYK